MFSVTRLSSAASTGSARTDGSPITLFCVSMLVPGDDTTPLLVSKVRIVLTSEFGDGDALLASSCSCKGRMCQSRLCKQSKSAGMRNGVTALFLHIHTHCVSEKRNRFRA